MSGGLVMEFETVAFVRGEVVRTESETAEAAVKAMTDATVWYVRKRTGEILSEAQLSALLAKEMAEEGAQRAG